MVNNPLSRFLNRPMGEGNLISPLDDARARILDILYATSAYFEAVKNNQLRAFGLMVQFLGELVNQLQPGAVQPDSGFNDCSYFIRTFKKYAGVTPLRFKQTHTQRAIR